MSFEMRWKNIFGGFVAFAALIISGCLYLDIRLAEFVSEKVGFGFLFSEHISNLPDLLFLMVCIITFASWTGRLWQAGKHAKGRMVNFQEHIGLTVPLAYVLKDLLKELFGRTNTRIWLLHPDRLGFHWFHGGGDFASFPSGHMAVFTVLMLGIGRYFPRLRPVCAGLLFVLALALLLTQYHFFSDIAAGACLGVIVDLLTWRGLANLRGSKDPVN
ncbi:MAG: phosphatase PAP2 family protein [Syntrophobacteraceae bacterium]|jgi:membrane-associated phospholipid phosphatase